MATEMLQYLDPDGLDETVLNIGQIKTSLEGQISDLGESIEEEMQNLPYARPDGVYPDMTVGAVIGADETAQWAQRTTEGSGAATLRSVQGAAVAWNQMNDNGASSSSLQGLTIVSNGDGSWTLNGTATADGYRWFASGLTLHANHSYLVKGCPAGGGENSYFLGISGAMVDTGNGGIRLWTAETTSGSLRFVVKSGASFDNVVMWPQLFDLTQMFGSGNEPSTVEEFERMYPEPYYPYSAPTLKPVQIAGIASTTAQGGELDGVEWDTFTLRGAGSIGDMLYSDHVETRVGVYTFTGTETVQINDWQPTEDTFAIGFPLALIDATWPTSTGVISNVRMAELETIEYGDMYSGTKVGICLAPKPQASAYSLFVRVPKTLASDKNALMAWLAGKTIFYALATTTTTPISPALPMTYKVQQGGSESVIVPDGEISAAPVLTIAEPVNMSTELARIWEAIQSLGYTRNSAQLSRPVSLTDIGSIDEVQKDTAGVAEIDTTKEVQE